MSKPVAKKDISFELIKVIVSIFAHIGLSWWWKMQQYNKLSQLINLGIFLNGSRSINGLEFDGLSV